MDRGSRGARAVIRKGSVARELSDCRACSASNQRDYKRFLNFLRKHDCQLPFKNSGNSHDKASCFLFLLFRPTASVASADARPSRRSADIIGAEDVLAVVFWRDRICRSK
jgi:hypothetical protein